MDAQGLVSVFKVAAVCRVTNELMPHVCFNLDG